MDALNFNDTFWESYNHTKGKIEYIDSNYIPTDARRYMSSSVMDLDPHLFADSLAGVGKYDVAAIKFAYGDLVETFDAQNPALYYENLLYLHDYNAIPKIFSGTQACAQSSGADCDDLIIDAFTAYQGNDFTTFNRKLSTYLHDAPNNVVTPSTANISKRGHTTLDKLKDAWSTYYNGGDYALPSIVPYEFCPDDDAHPLDMMCQPYDKGPSFTDVTTYRLKRFNASYLFKNFQPHRLFMGGSYIQTYLSTLIGRLFAPMSTMYYYHILSSGELGFDDEGNRLTFRDFPKGLDWQKAGLGGVNNLVSIINQPEPGTYCKEGDIYRLQGQESTCASNETLDIDLTSSWLSGNGNIGRHYNSQWTNEHSYEPLVIGSFYDKFAALWALSFYPDFSDSAEDMGVRPSHWTESEDEMLEVFSSAFTGMPSKFNWRVRYTSFGHEIFPAPVNAIYPLWDSDWDYDLPSIEAPTSWALRYYSMVLPMARFNGLSAQGKDFSYYARICLEADSECLGHISKQESTAGNDSVEGTGLDIVGYPDPLTGLYIVRYQDPLTDRVYVAPHTEKYGDWPGHADQKAIAATLLEEAQELAILYNAALHAYTADKSTANQATLNGAEEDLSAMNGLIELVRELSSLMIPSDESTPEE